MATNDRGANGSRLPAAAGPLAGGQQQAAGSGDCLSCRVTGTLVCTACSAYLLAINCTRMPPPSGTHRFALLALSGGFASMALVRALT